MTIEWLGTRTFQSVATPPSEFTMQVSRPYKKELSAAQVEDDYDRLDSIPADQLVFIIGALSNRINPETDRMHVGDIATIEALEKACTQNRLTAYHCFRRQNWGEYGIRSEDATLLDKTAVEKARVVIALPTIPQSVNAQREVIYRVSLGKGLIALIGTNPNTNYRNWLLSVIDSNPTARSQSALVTYDSLKELKHSVGEVLFTLRGTPLQVIPNEGRRLTVAS